jgi:hypothetical protein
MANLKDNSELTFQEDRIDIHFYRVEWLCIIYLSLLFRIARKSNNRACRQAGKI